MKIFDTEYWKCPSCDSLDESNVIQDWKCPTCGDRLWIMVEVDGNRFTLERVMAKDLEKRDLILIVEEDWDVIRVIDVMPHGDNLRIVFEDKSDIIESPEIFFNTIISNWQFSEDD